MKNLDGMTHEDLYEHITALLDELAEEHGEETFVSRHFGYYEDARDQFYSLILRLMLKPMPLFREYWRKRAEDAEEQVQALKAENVTLLKHITELEKELSG